MIARAIRGVVARLWFGRCARRAVRAAREDLARMPLPEVIRVREHVPLAPRPRRTAVRALTRAVSDRLRAEGGDGPCLLRSLTLLGEVRRLGYAPRVVIGMRRDGDAVAGHAWLELDGKPFLEAEAAVAEFSPMIGGDRPSTSGPSTGYHRPRTP